MERDNFNPNFMISIFIKDFTSEKAREHVNLRVRRKTHRIHVRFHAQLVQVREQLGFVVLKGRLWKDKDTVSIGNAQICGPEGSVMVWYQ